MSQLLAVKIELSKIDKNLFYVDKHGKKFLDVILIPKEGKYGDTHMCVQSVSKEAKARGEKGPILGNARPIGAPRTNRPLPPPQENIDEDVPF